MAKTGKEMVKDLSPSLSTDDGDVKGARENVRIIKVLKEGEKLKLEGPVKFLCNIPKNVEIEVTDGDVSVEGDVLEAAKITLIRKPRVVISAGAQGFSFSGTVTGDLVINMHNGQPVCDAAAAVPIPPHKIGPFTVNVTGKLHSKAVIDANGLVNCGDLLENSTVNANGAVVCGNIMKNASVSTRHASVKCQNIDGGKINAEFSDIQAKKVGPGSQIFTTYASIKTEDVDGATLSTSTGSIVAGDVKRTTIKAQKSRIQIGQVEGSRVETTYTSIHAGNIGANCHVETCYDSIHVGNVGAQSSIRNAHGNITAKKVSEEAREIVTSHADIQVEAAPNQRILKTSFGKIYVNGQDITLRENPAPRGMLNQFEMGQGNGGAVMMGGGSVILGNVNVGGGIFINGRAYPVEKGLQV